MAEYLEKLLCTLLEDKSNPLNIPPPKALPERNNPIPHFIVADDAFPDDDSIITTILLIYYDNINV